MFLWTCLSKQYFETRCIFGNYVIFFIHIETFHWCHMISFIAYVFNFVRILINSLFSKNRHDDESFRTRNFDSREFALRKKKDFFVIRFTGNGMRLSKRETGTEEEEWIKNLISIVWIDCSRVWNCRINAIFELDVWQLERRDLVVLCVRKQPNPKDNQQVSLSLSLARSLARSLTLLHSRWL